jgi:hypothetical protein
MSKQKVRAELVTLETEGQVSDLILQLQELVKEYGDTLDYEFETRCMWGDEYTMLVIYRNREETDEEYQGRLGRESYYAKMLVEKEKAEYERLTIKFKKPSF